MSDVTGGMTTAQFLEAARRAGEAIMKGGFSLSPASFASAAEIERMLVDGKQLGLTESEIFEVIDTWSRQTAYPADHQRVWQAIIARAMGEEWRPSA